jgi:hypothetical protein
MRGVQPNKLALANSYVKTAEVIAVQTKSGRGVGA